MDDNKLELVKDRLHFLSLLIDAKWEFSGGVEKMRKDENINNSHPYKDYTALRFYLVLTCFDILGQPNDWKDFQSWLISKKLKKERDSIISNNESKEKIEFVKEVYSDYLKIYGVKNSFYKFIREIISDENRKKLFDSIKIRLHNPEKSNDEIILIREKINLEIHHKEKFLFEIRNSFTHKGISIGRSMAGLKDHDLPIPTPPDWKPIYHFIPILKKNINGDIAWFTVQRWPFVLIEIIEDTINSKSKNL